MTSARKQTESHTTARVGVQKPTGRLRSPEQYRESLRDGRRVFYRGERVDDVITHPELRDAVEHATLDYSLAEDAQYRELAVGPDGYSRYFTIPVTSEDLLTRSRLIESSTREGRTLVVLVKEIGTDALFALHVLANRLGEPYATRIRDFYVHCRDNDLAMAVAQTDAKGDRSLPPGAQRNPDAYLRIVRETRDGIVVRGAKLHTSVSVNANELIVLPTRAMSEDDRDYAVAFAIPVATAGLTLVASPYLQSAELSRTEHPLSAGRKMVETVTLFNDVFVPSERVFLLRQADLAGELARGFVEFHRFTAISYKLPLVDALVGSGLLAARVNGLEAVGHVRDKLSWLVSYAETLRALTRCAALQCTFENGIAVPGTMLVNIAKLHFAQGLHTAFQHVQDIAGGLLVTYPGDEDLAHPEYGAVLRHYLAGSDSDDGLERVRVMNLVSDLTTGEYGGYQAVLAIHAEGSIEAEKLTIVAQYAREKAISYARWLAGLGDATGG